jgi:hypothetical protein
MEMDIATSIWRSPTAQTIAINIAGPATTAVFTPHAGKRFAVHYIFLQSDVVAGTVAFQSGSTAISGVIDLLGTTPERLEMCCDGMPILLGRANGDAFNIVTTGATFELDGLAVITQLDGIL